MDHQWSAIKFFGDAAHFILFKKRYFQPSYKSRYDLIRKIELSFPGLTSKDSKLIKKLILNALYCRLENKNFTPLIEYPEEVVYSAQKLIQVLFANKKTESTIDLYPLWPTRWITDWVRAKRLFPRGITRQLNISLHPPKYRIYQDIYNAFIHKPRANYDTLYDDWKSYCKY
jgi:hypothetical protein